MTAICAWCRRKRKIVSFGICEECLKKQERGRYIKEGKLMSVEATGYIKTHYSLTPRKVLCGTRRGSTGRFASTRNIKQVTCKKCLKILHKRR